jgi:hypothetical protein
MTIWTAAAIVVGGYCAFGLFLARYGKPDDTPDDIKALRRINTDTVAGRKRYLARVQQIAADRRAKAEPGEQTIIDIDATPYQRGKR